ncbi:unnamed protein product [Cochlearia groenlandica]
MMKTLGVFIGKSKKCTCARFQRFGPAVWRPLDQTSATSLLWSSPAVRLGGLEAAGIAPASFLLLASSGGLVRRFDNRRMLLLQDVWVIPAVSFQRFGGR